MVARASGFAVDVSNRNNPRGAGMRGDFGQEPWFQVGRHVAHRRRTRRSKTAVIHRAEPRPRHIIAMRKPGRAGHGRGAASRRQPRVELPVTSAPASPMPRPVNPAKQGQHRLFPAVDLAVEPFQRPGTRFLALRTSGCHRTTSGLHFCHRSYRSCASVVLRLGHAGAECRGHLAAVPSRGLP